MSARALRALGCALALGAGVARADLVAIGRPVPGAELYSASKRCLAKVLEAAIGGERHARLYRNDALIDDIAGPLEMAWLDDVLVFAVDPLRGLPGIYLWECGHGRVSRIVAPERVTREHPGGSDVFHLLEVDGDALYYAHAVDVDSPSLSQDLERGRESLSIRPFRAVLTRR
jgi:hypothetical protein